MLEQTCYDSHHSVGMKVIPNLMSPFRTMTDKFLRNPVFLSIWLKNSNYISKPYLILVIEPQTLCIIYTKKKNRANRIIKIVINQINLMLLAQAIEDRHLKTIRIFMVITMGRSTRFKDVRTQSLLRRMCRKYQVVSAGHRILLQIGL